MEIVLISKYKCTSIFFLIRELKTFRELYDILVEILFDTKLLGEKLFVVKRYRSKRLIL